MIDLVSIIMPVYNAEAYVAEAIDSVLAQDHPNWELLIINDGSKDRSGEIILSYKDPRIRYFEQENAGVSAARNVGLATMKGDFFCFLDGDDRFTEHSLSSRLKVFQQKPALSFVDGIISSRDPQMSQEISRWVPKFEGIPLEDLIHLTGKSFFGITWMIKRKDGVLYLFDTSLTHAEDLWFYIHLSVDSLYSFASEVIYLRRLHPSSAMSNLTGLADGYLKLEERLTQLDIPSSYLAAYRRKRKSIMFKTFLRVGKIRSAFRYLFS